MIAAAALVEFARGRPAAAKVDVSSVAATAPVAPAPESQHEEPLLEPARVEAPAAAASESAGPDEPVKFEPLTVGIMNEFSQRAAKQWETESRAADADDHETYVRNLFDGAHVSSMLADVECRTTMCRMEINVNSDTMKTPGSKSLTGHLGRSAAILKNDGEHVVALVPAGDLSPG
jgi:hypothetical protein